MGVIVCVSLYICVCLICLLMHVCICLHTTPQSLHTQRENKANYKANNQIYMCIRVCMYVCLCVILFLCVWAIFAYAYTTHLSPPQRSRPTARLTTSVTCVTRKSGEYLISPEPTNPEIKAFNVYCDVDMVPGQGITVIHPKPRPCPRTAPSLWPRRPSRLCQKVRFLSQ